MTERDKENKMLAPIDEDIREEFYKDNTEEEVEEIIKVVKESVERLRAMSPIYPGK